MFALANSARLVALVAVPAALALAAAGCGGSPNTTPAGRTSLAAQWHQVVLCARSHGMPHFPDPQINAQGKAVFPSTLNIPDATRRACQSMVDRLTGSSDNHVPTRAELASLLQFAHCMRDHGIPDWPDPRPDGSFHPDQRISTSLKSAFRSQLMACEHLNPDKNGRVYFSR
ncbi:MAG TPA: hypothetical protein VH210_14690 [Gaiellaceae bacterium]|nr:hypothetical protein [Gaiellaceae bacterium]